MPVILTDSDARKIREMYAWYKDQQGNRPPQDTHEDTIFPPEVYFAKPTESDGIPGLTSTDEPGSAECDIYKLNSSDPPALTDAGFSKEDVYNLSEAPIGQDWIEVKRTKFGKWFAGFTSDCRRVFGKMDEDISTGQTKTMSIWAGNPLSDTGSNLEVTDWLLGAGETIDSGKKVICVKYHGVWYIDAAEC